MGVTAVLNAAQGSMSDWNYVNTKDIYYTGVGIQFLGIPAIDLKWYPICNHFEEAANFIDGIVRAKGNATVAEMHLVKLANLRKPDRQEIVVLRLPAAVFKAPQEDFLMGSNLQTFLLVLTIAIRVNFNCCLLSNN